MTKTKYSTFHIQNEDLVGDVGTFWKSQAAEVRIFTSVWVVISFRKISSSFSILRTIPKLYKFPFPTHAIERTDESLLLCHHVSSGIWIRSRKPNETSHETLKPFYMENLTFAYHRMKLMWNFKLKATFLLILWKMRISWWFIVVQCLLFVNFTALRLTGLSDVHLISFLNIIIVVTEPKK